MKRTFTIALALIAGLGAFAQDNRLRFEDASGNIVADGTTIVVDKVKIIDEDTKEEEMSTGLFVRNTTTSAINACLNVDVTSLPSGSSFKACFPSNCSIAESPKTFTTESGLFQGSKVASSQTEWIPGYMDYDEGVFKQAYGDWTATIQIRVEKDGAMVDGPKVHVHFIRKASNGINDINAGNATVVARYTAGGQLITAPVRGLNIVKLSNGKTIKEIVR